MHRRLQCPRKQCPPKIDRQKRLHRGSTKQAVKRPVNRPINMASSLGSLSKQFSSLLHLTNLSSGNEDALLQQIISPPSLTKLLLLLIPTVHTQATKSPASLYPLEVHCTVPFFVPAGQSLSLDWRQSFGECCIHVPCRVELIT